MFLFNRTAVLRGNPRDIQPFVREITELVNERTPFDISLWQAMLGAPLGTFGWTALVDSRAVLLAGMAGLEQDEDYLALTDRALTFTTAPPEDQLLTVVHTAGGELRRAKVGSAATITIARAEVDRSSAVMAWSVGMADLVSSIIDVPVSLGMAQHGAFGELHWICTVDDIAEVDRATEAIQKDPEYMRRLDDAHGLFVPSSGRELLAIRIA